MRDTLKRGVSIFDPVPVGIREDGEIATIQLWTPDGGLMYLISGMSGAGKSWGETPVLLHFGALQCDQIILDPVKGYQSYRSVAGALQMYEVDYGRSRTVIKRLLTHVLPARTAQLTREGLGQWEPRSTLRPLRVHVEEAWKFANADALTGIGVSGRSAGIQLTVSLQQPTFDQMPTTLRNQMGAFRCYGLADKDYAEYSLPDAVVAAGAKPAQWGNEDPGMHYIVSHGMAIREKVMEVRSFSDGTGTNTFAAAAVQVAARLGPMCPVTAGSLGELWATHVPPLEGIRQLAVVGPVTAQALVTVTAVEAGPDDDLDDELDDELDDALADALADEAADLTVLAELGPDGSIVVSDLDSEYTLDVSDLDDPDDPDTDGDLEGFDPGPLPAPFTTQERDPDTPAPRRIGDPPEDGVTREEFDAALDQVVDAFLASGEDHIGRKAFIDVTLECGWSMGSTYKYLDRHPLIEKAGGPGGGWVPKGHDATGQDDEDLGVAS